jgi:hypothetical protein
VKRAEVAYPEVALDEPGGVFGEVGPSGFGQCLHSPGQPDGVADGRVLHVGVVADGADDDVSGVEPDPDMEAQALGAPQFVGVPADRVGQVQGGVAGPAGVVLVGDGSAEERHDAVAGELVDRPLEAVHPVGEDPHEPVHHRVPLLGVEVLLELHRPLHVGEEHRDLFVFPFQSSP